MRTLLRLFFASLLFGSCLAWLYVGYVESSKYEAILIENHYPLFASKDRVVLPKSWAFVPERIVPGRITLHRVRLRPRLVQAHIQKALQQSETLGLDESFYIQVPLQIKYEIEASKLSRLFDSLSHMDAEQIDVYLSNRIQDFFLRRIGAMYKDDAQLAGLKERLHNYFRSTAQKELGLELASAGVTVQALFVRRVFVPDAKHYQEILASSQNIIEQKLERMRILNQARATQQAQGIKDQGYFHRLEKIAQLLQSYPHLREYLAIDMLGKEVKVMVMPYQRWFDSALLARGLDSLSVPKPLQKPGSVQGEAQLPSKAPLHLRRPGAASPQSPRQGAFQDLTPP